jgi:hypothetical protein
MIAFLSYNALYNAKLAVTALNVPMISNLDEFDRPHDPRRLFFGTRRARG